jgi:hypothetical protein
VPLWSYLESYQSGVVVEALRQSTERLLLRKVLEGSKSYTSRKYGEHLTIGWSMV